MIVINRLAIMAAVFAVAGSIGAADRDAAAQEPPFLREGASSGNLNTVRKAYEDWAAGGTTFFNELLAADVRWTIRGSGPIARTYAGRDSFIREAVTPFGSRLAQPVKPEVRHLLADDDSVIAVWDGKGVARDGKPYENSYVWIFRMSDGKAVEVEAFLDLEPYYDVLRRIPPG